MKRRKGTTGRPGKGLRIRAAGVSALGLWARGFEVPAKIRRLWQRAGTRGVITAATLNLNLS